MWNKIRWINWNAVFGDKNIGKKALIEGGNDVIEGTNAEFGVTIKKFLTYTEALVFGVAVLFVLILGEINFFSTQVSWQTEPISAIGKQSSAFIQIS
jgi:hypothetical protein